METRVIWVGDLEYEEEDVHDCERVRVTRDDTTICVEVMETVGGEVTWTPSFDDGLCMYALEEALLALTALPSGVAIQ